MLGESKHDPQLMELEPELLSTPFAVQTNWHVITGAICCGKTTLINLLAECFHYRYASVFILDQLTLQLDGARLDDKAHTDLLDVWLTRDCSVLGYRVERVPVLSSQERYEFVLERLSELGLM